MSIVLMFLLNFTGNSSCLLDKNLNDSIRQADNVLVVKVENLGDPPLVWSGFADSLLTQQVKYKVLRTIKGKIRSKILVNHYVIRNRPFSDSKIPGLSAQVFSKGKTLFVFVKKSENEKNTYDEINSQCGVILYNRRNLNILEHTLLK